ncbi:DinB/UmuC family translesion DNA polymerase, partial [Escherichia coli]|uniref:DinB/UmuC family translesion DNA polymerase n=1 Tax=Escherichia coli TaxID=562 RepID=UPI003EB6D6B4
FIKTSPFAVNEPYYGNVATEKLNTPTGDNRDINAAAGRSLNRIGRDGHRYAKAGIMLNDFSPNGVAQLNLLDDVQPRPHSAAPMSVVDSSHHSGTRIRSLNQMPIAAASGILSCLSWLDSS